MWQILFGGPWPEDENSLPIQARQQATERIRAYWRKYAWQIALGEVILWAAASSQGASHNYLYGSLAGLTVIAYLLGLSQFTRLWLLGSIIVFMVQGMLISGLGAVTALFFILPYTFSGMLLLKEDRRLVQMMCMVAFWGNLTYEVLPFLPQLHPPNYILVSYNILLAVFIFQSLRFLRQLAVEVNTAYVAEEVRQQSQQFLARVSHELRTPLNSVLGFAKLLRRADLTSTHRQYLSQIIEESEQLNRLVSDLLDSAHLSTGKLTLNLDSCDVNTLCEAVAAEHQPSIPTAVQLRLELAAQLPAISADRTRLRQAIGNLLANAVKYTQQGEIALKTFQRDSTLCIAVQDTGIGIPESQQNLIFVPFVQLDNRRIGVGLGLDIASQLIRLHGGQIHVQSAPGQGSTFTIELPVN